MSTRNDILPIQKYGKSSKKQHSKQYDWLKPYQFKKGQLGKTYKRKSDAMRQARAIYASGYKK